MKLKSFILAALVASSLTVTTPAKAAVGGLFLGPVVTLAGFTLWAYGLGGVMFIPHGAGWRGLSYEQNMWQAIIAGSIGIVLLDSENEQPVKFVELDSDQASKLGITDAEAIAFNAEIDQVNFLYAEVESKLLEVQKPTAQDSLAAWQAVSTAVSPETISALQKISTQLYQK